VSAAFGANGSVNVRFGIFPNVTLAVAEKVIKTRGVMPEAPMLAGRRRMLETTGAPDGMLALRVALIVADPEVVAGKASVAE
jgi:hypothetical protein